MSPAWFYHNVREAWSERGSFTDFCKRMQWVYDDKLPVGLRHHEQLIRFCLPAPINDATFLVRSNGGSDSFIFGEVFHHEFYKLPSIGPSTILDLGANAGFTAVYFSRCFPTAQIACVEPMPGNVRVLKRNCELNGVSATVFSAAVATADGKVLMEITPKDYGHRVIEPTSSAAAAGVPVDAMSVPTIMKRLGWDKIGLLKVDIEGYERELFRASCPWLWLVDALCIECHDGFGEADLNELAMEYGFHRPQALPGIWFLNRH